MERGKPERITTGDGSHSLYLPHLKETYHSTHGAIQESLHVFIRNGLSAIRPEASVPVYILEIGLGTGLNALLTAQWARENKHQVHMVSIEAFPVEENIWENLNYAEQTGDSEAGSWWRKIHESEWNKETIIHDAFFLTKRNIHLEDFRAGQSSFDVVFYDAFAPGKQPEMWAPEVLGEVIKSLKKDGVLVTYCAQGQFKRDLASLGMKVESLAGPPGKKEMTRAAK